MDRPFDVSDFLANPGKYELFRTAQIASRELHGLPHGDYVSVEYLYNAREDVIQGGKVIPVYAVKDNFGNECHLYANAFMNFCL